MDVEERRVRLDKYYNLVKKQLLQYQSGSIGLFLLHTSGENEESHVRDSTYCAIAAWSLALAYRHLDDSKGRTYELQQSAVKCMRGILFCWMRQADKVEHFKRNQLGHLSLHSKFNVNTGDVVCSESDFGHLQIDVVAQYLLTLVQMTTSGLQIIYTTDEVNFIQNLVYYIERAYRTPDYGMWERGTKENNGTRELHSCSIGMAKAALEAINGFNAYGAQGTSSSVIYVDPDAHNRNVTILNSLLPRASSSKVTDASLLTVIGFPAFVVDDEALKNATRKLVVDKLEGKYGLKRFPKDGFMTVLEDRNRRYYEKNELEQYDGIECEWPLFFIYLALDAIFRNDVKSLEKYTRILKDNILVSSEEGDLLPKYFYVPAKCLEAERRHPHSQERECNDVEDEGFLWGQSMLLLLNLLVDGLLDVHEIDPIGRHLVQSRCYAAINFRYSSFQIADCDPVVQVILISETNELQATLAMFGIETETPQQIDPIQLWPPGQLVKAYERLGVNHKLGLRGRPARPIGALGTSKIYRILGRTVVSYPKVLDESDFYLSLDMSLVIDDIKSTLAFVRNNWHLRGRPTITIFLREQRLRGKHFPEMLEMLASFKRGECNGIKIRMGKLQTLVSTACVDHLDFVQRYEPISADAAESELGFEVECLKERSDSESNRSLNVRNRKFTLTRGFSVSQSDSVIHYDDDDGMDLVTKSREGLVAELHDCPSENRKMLVLQELLNREGKLFVLPNGMGTVVEQIESVYKQAGYDRKWNVVRRGAGLLGKLVDSLAPGITTILVRGKVVTIGVFGHEERVIYEPLTPAAIQKIIYSYCSPHDVREAVLQQELVLYLASFISTTPELFNGMLKIRIGWIIQAMKIQLALWTHQSANFGSVYSQSPSNVKKLLMIVLTSEGNLHGYNVAPRTPLDHRQLNGAVHRTPPNFYGKVWHILAQAPSGLKISRHLLPQFPTIKEMSHDEKNFALKVEELLSDISSPEYRQIVIELLMVLATVLERNPEVEISKCIDLDALVEDAIEMFRMDSKVDKNQEREKFYNLPTTGKGGTMTYLTRAVVNQLLEGGVSVSSEKLCVVS